MDSQVSLVQGWTRPLSPVWGCIRYQRWTKGLNLAVHFRYRHVTQLGLTLAQAFVRYFFGPA